MDVRFDFLNSWYGRMEDIIEDLEDNGYEVAEANREYITVYGDEDEDGNDVYFIIRLGGTESTITIESTQKW